MLSEPLPAGARTPIAAPRSPDGAPARAHSEAWRRVLAGEPPEQVSAVWPAFGALVPVGGRLFRQVAFVVEADAPGDRVLLQLDGITAAHRADLRGAVLDEVPGSRLRVIDHLLPDDLVLSYSFVSAPEFPDDAGASHEGWFRILAAGVPDARNPRRLWNQFGRWSSVLHAPGAREHPAWSPEPADGSESVAAELPLLNGFEGRTATVLTADVLAARDGRGGPERLLLLLDGEQWEQVGIRDALGHYAPFRAGGLAVVLVPSGTLEERWAVLPHPEQAAALVQSVLEAAHARLGRRVDPETTVIAGQSFGGLAAASVVSLRPDLAGTAVVQSGSFHFRAGEPPADPAGRTGDLVQRLDALGASRGLTGRRFVVQSGTEESGMTDLANAFAASALCAGATVQQRVYPGGHDHAWWRTGLFDALDELSGTRDG